MKSSVWPAFERGRQYAFPAVWVAVFATGVGLSEPFPSVDVAPYLSFAPIGVANAAALEQPAFLALNAEPAALPFLPPDPRAPAHPFHPPPLPPSPPHAPYSA